MGSSPKDCLEPRGAEPDQFDEFSATLSNAAGLPYAKPHSFRDTLVRLGQRMCRTPEEWKVWSQNLGHENEATTFVGYGQVSAHRHAEIMRAFCKARPDPLPPDWTWWPSRRSFKASRR